MRICPLIFSLIYSFNVLAQTHFEKGYFITNENKKIDCLIENADWVNNPNSFNYKLTETSIIQSSNITEVKWFEIYNSVKYIRANVKVDISSTVTNNLSKNKQPILIERELFLKEIVSGEANLYEYNQNLIHKFFYSTSLKNIQPLIYKEYISKNDQVAKNNSYQQELFNNLVCDNITLKQIKKLNYKQKDLINLFVQYNLCKNPEEEVKKAKFTDKKYNFTLRPRVNFFNFKSDYINENTQISIGAEIEHIFPIKHNKWAVFIDPNYVGYKKYERRGDIDIHLKFSSIEVPLGVRYALFMNNKSKIYINAACVFDVHLGSSLKIERKIIRYEFDKDIKSNPGFAFGVGYKFKERYNIEVRTTTKRKYTIGELNNTSIILGYRIF